MRKIHEQKYDVWSGINTCFENANLFQLGEYIMEQFERHRRFLMGNFVCEEKLG